MNITVDDDDDDDTYINAYQNTTYQNFGKSITSNRLDLVFTLFFDGVFISQAQRLT